MRIIGYTRVSTGEQAESGAGLEAQRAALEAACESRGFELVRVIEDAGASGKTLSRPGLDEALQLIAAGEADGIMVSKLDRLSRSVIDFGNLLAVAEKGGWNIVALDFGVDLSTPSGKLVANVLMAVAQWEREAIGQRTKDALAVKREQGVKLGRPRVIDEALRARITESRSRGVTLAGIASELASEGVPTAHGGTWRASTIAGVLR